MASEAVGHLIVKVYGARGLGGLRTFIGKPATFCVVEFENTKVQTHTEIDTVYPVWNEIFRFQISDITSTLEITVIDDTFMQSCLGQVSIPLLRVTDGEKRWYALTDECKPTGTSCPRIQLKLHISWSLIKASFRALSERGLEYKMDDGYFDIPLVYTNLKFLKAIFRMCVAAKDYYTDLFEWDNKVRSAAALAAWVVFWFYFRVWMLPASVILVILYYMVMSNFGYTMSHSADIEDYNHKEDEETSQGDEEQILTRLQRLKSITIVTNNGIEFVMMLFEKTKNLLMFQVPFLSCIAIVWLSVVSIVLYYIPLNILLMIFALERPPKK